MSDALELQKARVILEKTKEYIDKHSGSIDSITINGEEIPIVDKSVNLSFDPGSLPAYTSGTFTRGTFTQGIDSLDSTMDDVNYINEDLSFYIKTYNFTQGKDVYESSDYKDATFIQGKLPSLTYTTIKLNTDSSNESTSSNNTNNAIESNIATIHLDSSSIDSINDNSMTLSLDVSENSNIIKLK